MKDLVEKKMERQVKLTDGVDGLLLLRVTINHGPKSDGLHTFGLGFKTWASFSTGALDTEWLRLSYVCPKMPQL